MTIRCHLEIFAALSGRQVQVALAAYAVLSSRATIRGTQCIQSRKRILQECRIVIKISAVSTGIFHDSHELFLLHGLLDPEIPHDIDREDKSQHGINDDADGKSPERLFPH